MKFQMRFGSQESGRFFPKHSLHDSVPKLEALSFLISTPDYQITFQNQDPYQSRFTVGGLVVQGSTPNP